jgi:hypothetical protein
MENVAHQHHVSLGNRIGKETPRCKLDAVRLDAGPAGGGILRCVSFPYRGILEAMGANPHKSTRGVIRVGISGWTYAPWRGTFYPKKLAQKNELRYASAMLPSIEINGTFYGPQRPKSYAAWHDQTPDGFVFSAKAPRFITHILRLREVKTREAGCVCLL